MILKSSMLMAEVRHRNKDLSRVPEVLQEESSEGLIGKQLEQTAGTDLQIGSVCK